MKLLIGFVVLIIIFYLSATNWRRAINAVFILLVIEGALRKWVLPQASEMIYFLKDIVIIGAYFSFYCFPSHDKRLIPKNFIINILIFISIGWCIFQVFNSSLGSPVVGLLGLRGYLLYIPLVWMVPCLYKSEDELYKFLRSHLLFTIPVGFIGIVQFLSPASSFINKYTDEGQQNVVTFGVTESVRITGTFAYISGYGVYLIVCFCLLIFMLSSKQSRGWKTVSIIEIFLVTINSFMTGSRGTVFAEVLFLGGYLGTKGLTNPTSILRLVKQLIVPVIIVSIAASIWFRPAINSFLLRTTSNHDVGERITSSFTEPFDFMQYKQLDGYGLGATHQATPALRKALDLPEGEVIPVYYEAEMGRVALELGPIGFLFWYGMRVSILLALMSTFWKLKRPFLRQLALAAFFIQATQINSFLVFTPTYVVYYWFLSGLIFLLPQLEKIENWKIEEQLWQEDVLSPYFSDSSYR